MNPEAQITTIEVIKAGWPVVVGLIGIILWLGRISFMTGAHEDFIKKEYENDRASLLAAIREVKTSQEKGEERLEGKLDKMATSHDQKLDKVYDIVNSIHISLAELKGRFHSKNSGNDPNIGG